MQPIRETETVAESGRNRDSESERERTKSVRIEIVTRIKRNGWAESRSKTIITNIHRLWPEIESPFVAARCRRKTRIELDTRAKTKA